MTQPKNQPFERRLSTARAVGSEATHDLIERYRNYLMVLASIGSDRDLRAKVGDSDLVQETMIQAHKDFHQFRGMTEVELLGWLRCIMSTKQAYLARRYYGTKARDPKLEEQLRSDIDHSSEDLDHALAANDTSPSQHLVKRERAVLLADALAMLPAHYREVVLRYQIQGQSLASVALSMGRTVDSVKKQWARAIVQLRSALKDASDD